MALRVWVGWSENSNIGVRGTYHAESRRLAWEPNVGVHFVHSNLQSFFGCRAVAPRRSGWLARASGDRVTQVRGGGGGRKADDGGVCLA